MSGHDWGYDTEAEALDIARKATACLAEVGVHVVPKAQQGPRTQRWVPQVGGVGICFGPDEIAMVRKAWALVGYKLGIERMACYRHGGVGDGRHCARVPTMAVLLDPTTECGEL